MDKVYFYANLRQGVVLAIDRGRLMGDPFKLKLLIEGAGA